MQGARTPCKWKERTHWNGREKSPTVPVREEHVSAGDPGSGVKQYQARVALRADAHEPHVVEGDRIVELQHFETLLPWNLNAEQLITA